MKLNTRTSLLLVLIALFTLQAAHAQTRSQASGGDPTYLVFQMGADDKDFATVLPELKAEFGAKPAGGTRYVGFGVALMTLKTPIEELRRQVTRALNSAEETGLPVLIKLDDMNFPTEYTDPSMVEWTGFPKPGEAHGPLVKHYWLNWGTWMALPPTPNLESVAFRKNVEMRLKEGVLPGLLERLARWKDQNRSYLFAGVCVGWESGIPEYRPMRQAAVLPRDEQRKITMTEEERGVQFGYASLNARGWTQQKIQETSAKTGKSVEDVTTDLLFQVIHDYTSFFAQTVHDAGIPKERIYTHGVAWESVPDKLLPGAWMRKSSRVPPIWVNVNAYSRPGYTTGAGQFDSASLVKLLRAAGAQDGWGAVEAYVRGVESEDAFGGYLSQLFGSGARMVDIFGWTAAGSPYDPKRAPGALRSIHSWLEGKELRQAPAQTMQAQGTAPAVPQSLQEKMHQLEALVGKLQQQGIDLQPVGDLMQGFQPLVQQQKFTEAEALLDRALKVAKELRPPSTPQTNAQGGMPQSLQEKMQRLRALVERLQKQEVDLQPVGDVMQGFQPLVQEQKFGEAEALVDRAFKIAEELASSAARQTGPPRSLQEKMRTLQALVEKRQQAGGDMQPIGDVMQGLQPLMDQQKFSEAETLVDRALKLLGESAPAGEVASPPGDTALIAYGARDDDGRQQIFVVRPDGTGKRRLTQEGDQNYLPAWSRDGRKLAFTSNRSGRSQIWVMAADGSNPTQLTTESDNAVPTWSPDGKRLAFASKRTGNFEIWVMNADGSDQKQLTKTDVAIGNDGPAWSPDGRRIAFYSNRSGHFAIWLMDPDGSHLTQFTTVEGDRYMDSNAPAWSPDGTKIAFWWGVAHKSGNIWVMNVDGSNRKQLTDQPVGINADGPAWSPDGKKILFSSNRPGSQGIGNWIMNADGSDQRVFTTNTFVRARPSWQPSSTTPPTVTNGSSSNDAGEGKYGLIALTFKDEAGKLQIFTIRPDGSQKKQLTFEGDNGRPDWSPDGTRITFASIRNATAWVGVMAGDGSNQKLLTEGKAPDWSPDGRQIAFSRSDGQIWVMNADGTNIQQVTHSNNFKAGPSWSPNGKQMVFILVRNPESKTDPQPQIGIMNSDGTNERILTANDRSNVCREPDGRESFLATAHDANAPAWSPVDNRIAMWSGIEKRYGQIWVINFDGTGSVQLTKECSRRNNDDPSWSQDGKKILFSTGRSGVHNELWVIDSDGRNEKRLSNIDAYPFPGRASWQPIH